MKYINQLNLQVLSLQKNGTSPSLLAWVMDMKF